MALSLGDIFPVRGSRRAAALAHDRAAKSPARKRTKAAMRPSALAFETFEPRMLLSADTFAGYTVASYLANPVFGTGVSAELMDAADLIDDIAQQANGAAEVAAVLATEIPGLLDRSGSTFEAPTLGDVLGNASNDFNAVRGSIVSLFNDASLSSATTPAALATALEALFADVGDGLTLQVNLLDADPDTAGVQTYRVHTVDADTFELLYNLEVVVTLTDPGDGDTFSLDLGRNADALEVDYKADQPLGTHLPSIKVSSSYRIETVFGISADIVYDNDLDNDGNIEEDAGDFGVVVTPTSAFLRDPSFEAGIVADTTTSAIPALQFGFLDVRADAGTAEFDMHVAVSFAGTIDDAGDMSSPTVETGGDIEVILPISVDPSGVLGGDGFSGASPSIRLYSDNPFDTVHSSIAGSDDGRTAISIQLQDFDKLNPFRNIDSGGMANVFSGLGTMLEQLQAKAQLFGLTLPVIDSTKISDLLEFDGPMKTLYEALTVEKNGAREASFVSVQDFVTKLQTALNNILATYNANPDFADVAAVVGINPRYEFLSGTPTLRFTIDLRANTSDVDLDLEGDLGLDLSPVGEVALTGTLGMDASFAVQLTLGIELVEPPNVGVVTVVSPSALVGSVVDGNVAGSEDVEFSLVLGGVGSVRVTLNNQDYGSTAALAAALETAIGGAISSAISAGTLAAASPGPDVDVDVNAQGRLVIGSAALPYLQIVNRGDATAFAELGFQDGQRATVSRLPADGRLSGNASFSLTVGAAAPVAISITAAETAGFTTPEQLVALLNTKVAVAGATAVLVGEDQEGDDVVGRRIKISAGQSFVRIDAADAVAQAELGLQNDAVSSKLMIRGDGSVFYDANDPASPLPASGNAGAVSFTVTLTQGGASSGAIAVNATLSGNNLDGEGNPTLTAAQAAIKAAQDINDALASTTLSGDQKLGSVLVATPIEFRNPDGTGNGNWGIRFIQPAATVDTTLAYAFADSIAIAGIGGAEDIGIADGTANRSGPALTSTLGGDASFTINLSGASGAVTQQVITLDDAAITNTLAGVVDAINAAINAGGSTIAGKVVVGLEGARLVFAVTDSTVTVIELSSVNAVAQDDLGLQEGISARTFEGVQAFVEDLHMDASLAVDGTASGNANFGFVELDLGTATVALDAAVDVDITNRIHLKDLFNALGRPMDAPNGLIALIDGDSDGNIVGLGIGEDEEIDLDGSASVTWDGLAIGIEGTGDAGVADDLAGELAEVASPFIHVTLGDITDLSTLDVDADLGSLADLANFSFDDALAVLRAIADWLQSYTEQLDIVNEPLPLLGISLADTLAFVDDFTQAVEDIADNPTKTLQSLLDKVNEGLQQFVGPSAVIGYIANSPGILTFNLNIKRNFSDILPLEIDMVELLADEVGIEVPGLELNGSANLAAEFGFEAELVFGVDVGALSTALDDPVHTADDVQGAIFLVVEDTDAQGIDGYTHLAITAYAAAENVTFVGALGPLGLFVTNGGAVLNKTGVFGDTDAAELTIELPDLGDDDGYLTLADFFDAGNLSQIFNPANVEVDLGVAAVLPVSFPTSSNFIGNLDFTALVTDPFGAGGVDYTLNSIPDFSQVDLGSLGLLDTINLFLAGADTVLGTLGDLITGEVFGADAMADLPLVGDALDDAGAFIDQIRDEVIPQITELIETAPELLADIFADIGAIIQEALSTLSFLGTSVKLDLIDADGNVFKTYDFDPVVSAAAGYFDDLAGDIFAADGFSYTLDLGIDLHLQPNDVNLNLEVFQLAITDPITVDIAADLTFGIGVSLQDGFFFMVNPDGEADLSGSITIDLPSEIDAQLFFLTLTAVNNNTEPDLAAAFTVDVLGTDEGRVGFGDLGDLDFDVDFGAQVDLDFQLELGIVDIGGITMPRILADFDFAWGFGDVTIDSLHYGVDTDHPELPLLSLGNIRLDIASFFEDTIGPFIGDLYEVLEPIDPILDILTDPIPVLSDLLGPTSLLDVAATFGIVNPALVTALETLDGIVDFAGAAAGEEPITLFADTLSFGGNSGLDLTDINQVGALADPSQILGNVLQSLKDSFGIEVPPELQDALDFIASGFDTSSLPGGVGAAGGGFTFPFLENFEEVLGLFFGRNMTIVAYDLPALEFGFDFSIYVPIWDGLGARFAGGINAVIDLAFGYDTEGIRRFIEGGQNPLDLAMGFFVYDDNPFGGFTGIDVPEVEITGEITAAAELNLVVASAGVGGGIFATIGFDLADPDGDFRVRLDEIIANLVNGFEQGVGPLGLFDVDALIEAKLFAYIEALFGLWRKEFQFGPSLPLYEAHYEVPHDAVLATDMENGTLRLNAGDFAQDRIYTDNGTDIPVDGDEEFELKILSTTEIQVRGRGPDFDEWGDWQTYENDDGFDLITAFAGIGNDIIKVVQDDTAGAVRVEFAGGAGDDELQGGKAADLLVGDSGADTLKGGEGNDDILGGTGADCLEGEAGNDSLTGDAGNDVMEGGAGTDLILGDAGDDILAGGDDADTVLGGDGADLIAGGGAADVLMGEAGNDRLWGDLDFSFTACVLDLAADGDEPALTVPALEGADYIAGGGGSDEIQGNGADDSIWGDSSFKLDASHALQFDLGKPLVTLPLFGNFGADNLSGGAGNDTLYGEAGNDVIRGDNLRVDTEDDDNPFTWAEGDRFSAGTAHGGTDGDDTIYAGRDSDIAYGNGGDDIIAGGTENDILFGNADDDTITGDVGADVVFGDNGVVQVWLAGDDIDGSEGSATYGAATQDFKLLQSYTDAADGDDWIDAGQDNDIVFGGGGLGLQAAEGAIAQTIEDLIKAGSGDDIAFGDHGRIDFTYSAGAAAAYATRIESVDKAFGGDDQIFGSTGRDVLIGGKGGDFVNGDDAFNPDDPDSRDVVAGDHVLMTQVVTLVTITPNAKVADVYVAAPKRIVSSETAPAEGGDDTLDGRQDDDFLIGGPGDDSGTGGLGNDVLLGDRGQIDFDLSFINPSDPEYVFDKGELFVLQTVQSTDLNAATDIPFTGVDELSGGDGNDVVIGGGRGDKLFGDAELDGTVGPLTSASDILLGDNGRVDYLQHGGLAKVRTTDTSDATGGDDTIEGNAGIDIAMGGVGGDTIYGDAAAALGADGDDILLGDNGEVDFTRDLDANLAPTGASPANLATLDLIVSYTDGLGGSDTISGNAGADVAMGGTAGDVMFGDAGTVAAGDGRDILLGDNGRVELVNPALDADPDAGTDRMTVRGGAVALIRSTDEEDEADDTGGSDSISGNAGGDIMLGGVRGDRLWGDREIPTAGTNAADGNDIILGDNGALEWLSTGRLGELSFDPADARWNAALPAAFAARDGDLDTLDVVTTEQPNNGGRDIIYGGNGRDIAMGGTDADSIWGDTGDDALLSAGSVDGTSNGNDLLFGDHGRVYMQLSVLSNISSRNFFAIDIEQGDGGEGDRIWGEEGMDILLGQQGDDRLWGGSEDDDLIGGHNVEGGADELVSTTIEVATAPGEWNDVMDGGSENDVMAGDNAIVWRTGDELSPRFRTLTGDTLYTTTESTVTVNVDGTPRQDPDDTRGRFVFLLDHADTTAAGLYGNDVMAGGAHRDLMFGQLGDDLMQGDGMIDGIVPAGGVSVTLSILDSVGAPPGETGGTLYFRVPEQTSDGDDAMEGNGGGDVMLGGLGQDDMIGGSSSLYGLTTPEMRPDGSDDMWGGAGIQTAHGDLGYLQVSLDGADPDGTAAETVLAAERGRDADHMLGDNGNIFRIVSLDNPLLAGGETTYRRYQYDNAGYTGGNWLVVRASEWLDYTLGGPDFDQDLQTAGVQSTQSADNGAGDYMHGEAGNDHVHGMAGSDILFGDAHDDDVIGGYGHDWISGGTGQDGVIGDDGIIRTSRNSTTGETLFGVAGLLASDPNPKEINGNALNETIETPGDVQTAVINKAGELAKAMDLTPLSVDALWGAVDDEFGYAGQSAQGGAPYADDIIYGGTGSDWLHGGAGDDGILGGEALPYFYARAMLGAPSATTLGGSSVNAGDQLLFNPEDVDGSGPNRQRAGEFALYDEYAPLEEIRVSNAAGWGTASDRVRPGDAGFAGATPFFLNFDALDGVLRASENVSTNGQNVIVTGIVYDDGDDRIFGDTGNDWLVGGTGRDDAYGGWGNDLSNMDDRHSTNNSLNDQPDTHSTYEDRAYGGAGRDVLIGNTGGDRLIDWVGEWNSYLVPFAPYGMATVSRTLQPHLPEFLYALSRADGADPTIVADGNGTAARNGEPFGELGLVLQQDAAWQDQTGAPSDPQAGNIPGGKRDVLRSADFNNQQGQGFVPESGSWSISGGRYEVAPSSASGTTDAISLYFTGEPLPTYFEIAATINAVKPTAGFKANAYIIFDYVSPTDFKFAGLNISTNKIEIGQRASWGFQVLASVNSQLKFGQDYNVLLAVNGNAVTFVVNGAQSVSHAFAPRIDSYGISHPIRDNMYGLGADNARAQIDDVRLQILPPNYSYVANDDFTGAGSLLTPETGNWTTNDGRLAADPGAGIALASNPIAVDANSILQIDARLSLTGVSAMGGIVFDQYSDTDFKFVAISAATQQVVIGHYSERSGWVVDSAVSVPGITTGLDYALGVSLKGSTVSVTLGGSTLLSYSFNSTVVDGGVGVLAKGGAVSFDSFGLKTNDASVGAASITDANTAPAIDWSLWNSGVAAGSPLVAAAGDVLWQEQFVSRLAARSAPGGLNSSLYFRL